MHPISKIRLLSLYLIPYRVTLPKCSKHKMRNFYIRKRLLHKGYQVLEEIISHPRETKFDFIKDCKDWSEVMETLQSINKKLKKDIKIKSKEL